MAIDGHARRQAVKRAEIVAAATDVFFAQGFGRTSMDEVLARVGGSKRTLYSHFPSKDDLFRAIVTQVSDRVVAALRPTLDGGDVRATLFAVGVDYLNVLLSPDGLALYRTMVAEAPHFRELAKAFFENGPGRVNRDLAVFLKEQNNKGVLTIEDPELAADLFLGMVRGDGHLAAVLSVRKPTKQRVKRIVDEAVDTFLDRYAMRTDG